MVGPEKPIDTNKFFVICSNVLGGCAGSTGPKQKKDGKDIFYGSSFPLPLAPLITVTFPLFDFKHKSLRIGFSAVEGW